MKSYSLSILFVCSMTMLSCNLSKKITNNASSTKYDNTSKKFKVNGLWVIPKHSTEFDTLLKSTYDTLDIAVNSTYIYFPFGAIKAKVSPDLGLLKNFNIKNVTIKTDIGDMHLQILKHGSSRIIYSFNATYKGSNSDLYEGEIYDTDVQFVNDIQIGMSIDDFYSHFFDLMPIEIRNKYACFMLESVDGIKHIYSFENNKLKSVKFTRNTYWKLGYDPVSQ
jgi:hypothetical protein